MNAEQVKCSEAMQQPIPVGVERQELKPERVQQTLARLLGWAEIAGAPGIHRARQFGSPDEAQAYARFALKLAARRRQPVAVNVSGRQVSITLKGRPGRNKAGLLSNAVYGLACALG